MRVALTYDDGPSLWTAQLLDILDEYDAKATFFVRGGAIRGNTHLLQRMVAGGHHIGNHSYSHRRLTALEDEEVLEELMTTGQLIHDACDQTVSLWRAPYLDTNERVNKLAARLGLRHVGVTVDPSDWKSGDYGIYQYVLRDAADGAVVDLHDGLPADGGGGLPTRVATVTATEWILQDLDAEFVTVPDLIGATV